MPWQLRKTFTYRGQEQLLIQTLGGRAYWHIAVNDLHDPDVTYTGHQPAGWDQLRVFYLYATVVRVRVTWTIGDPKATAGGQDDPINAVTMFQPTAGAYANMPNMAEQDTAQVRMISSYPNKPTVIKRGWFRPSKGAGLNLFDATYRCGAQASASPTTRYYHTLMIVRADDTLSQTGEVAISVKIEYDTILYNRPAVAQS